MFIKKFYDALEGKGGIAYNPFEGAKSGDISLVDPDEPEVEADEKPAEEKVAKVPEEKVEEKPAEEKVDEKVEIPEEKPEEVKEEKVVVPVLNFDEELKKIDKYEALKKLGFDDFDIDLLKYKEQTGDLTPYLEAKTVDYSKFTDEQIMKHDLRQQYKDMPDKVFDMLYEQKVNEQYKLDAEVNGEAAAELGRELLKHEANKIRKGLIETQSKFKAPEKPVDDSAQRQQAEQEAKYNEYKSFVDESDQTKTLLKDKKLVYGSGETAFNFNVEKPKDLVETALNPNLLFNDLVDKKGNADLAKVYKAKAYIANMDKIEQMLISHGETIGKKKAFDELQNPTKKDSAPSITDTSLTPAQALAKFGKFKESN
jgi:hypothetical protein